MVEAEVKVEIRTLGVFRVRTSAGEDLTPRSQKACGLLALLCLAPNRTMSRAALQDKLWSDRAQEQGAASLRQCLTEIRKSFGAHRDILQADARVVGLDSDAVRTDLDDRARSAGPLGAGAVFLDGIGIKDPEFDDWLRDTRLELEEAAAPAPESVAPVERARSAAPLLHLATHASGGHAILADFVVHAIAKGVSDLGTITVRDGLIPSGAPAAGVYVLEAHEQALGDGVALRVQLTTAHDGRVCWQMADVLPASALKTTGAALTRLINNGVDRTSAALSADRPFGSLASQGLGVGTAATLHRMWTTAASDPDALIAELRASFAREGRGIHLAWEAFVWCFVVGERRHTPSTREEARDLIRRAIELEPHNPLVLALASHVHGFVLRDFAVSLEMAERAVKLDRHNVLAWTFLAIARLNWGRNEAGYEAASHARQIAGEGPYRHFLDTALTFAASLTGRTEEATLVGETAHAMRPDYAASLRYLLATYVSSGDVERARLTVERLRRIEPDFEPSLLLEPDYPAEPIRRSGLIDLRKPTILN